MLTDIAESGGNVGGLTRRRKKPITVTVKGKVLQRKRDHKEQESDKNESTDNHA